jgi:hypothetical protein
MEGGKEYGVRIRWSDGTVLLEQVVLVPGERNEITFVTPVDISQAPKTGDLYAFGIRGMEVIDLVITDIQPGENLTATLTCVEYSPEIFGVDEPDFVLPDFVNKVSPVQGAIDHGTINPDSWRLFQTCHDGEDIPPLFPPGTGSRRAGIWYRRKGVSGNLPRWPLPWQTASGALR